MRDGAAAVVSEKSTKETNVQRCVDASISRPKTSTQRYRRAEYELILKRKSDFTARWHFGPTVIIDEAEEGESKGQ